MKKNGNGGSLCSRRHRDDSGKLVACLSISSPASSFLEGWISEIKHTADDISEHLGYVATPGELYVRPDFT